VELLARHIATKYIDHLVITREDIGIDWHGVTLNCLIKEIDYLQTINKYDIFVRELHNL